MNRKITTIIITGTTLATVLAIAAGCMKKSETSRLLPVTRPAAVTVETGTTEQRKADGAVTQIEPISFTIGTPANTEETAPAAPTETEAKQVPQKAKKTVKKTKKVTKKVTKKKTKKSKKTSKKTAAKQLFTYGTTEYVSGNVTVTVRITKDNMASVEVNKRTTDRDGQYHCEHFSFTGTINKKTGVLNYSDCTKMYFAGTNSGMNVRTHFTDGKGTVKFCGNQIIWTDNNSKDYQSVKCTKA